MEKKETKLDKIYKNSLEEITKLTNSVENKTSFNMEDLYSLKVTRDITKQMRERYNKTDDLDVDVLVALGGNLEDVIDYINNADDLDYNEVDGLETVDFSSKTGINNRFDNIIKSLTNEIRTLELKALLEEENLDTIEVTLKQVDEETTRTIYNSMIFTSNLETKLVCLSKDLTRMGYTVNGHVLLAEGNGLLDTDNEVSVSDVIVLPAATIYMNKVKSTPYYQNRIKKTKARRVNVINKLNMLIDEDIRMLFMDKVNNLEELTNKSIPKGSLIDFEM